MKLPLAIAFLFFPALLPLRAELEVAVTGANGRYNFAVDAREPIRQAHGQQGRFEVGVSEVGLKGGGVYGPVITCGPRPKWGWAKGDFQYGYMLSSPRGEGFWRGNWEIVVNPFGAAVTRGPGHFFVGGRVLARYNFVQPEARLVPYIELGAGGLYNDASRDRSQAMIGGPFEFTLVANAGFRYFLRGDWFLLGEISFEHVSNAGFYRRNQGANGIGYSVGLGCMF